jgi:hypothetical protein
MGKFEWIRRPLFPRARGALPGRTHVNVGLRRATGSDVLPELKNDGLRTWYVDSVWQFQQNYRRVLTLNIDRLLEMMEPKGHCRSRCLKREDGDEVDRQKDVNVEFALIVQSEDF